MASTSPPSRITGSIACLSAAARAAAIGQVVSRSVSCPFSLLGLIVFEVLGQIAPDDHGHVEGVVPNDVSVTSPMPRASRICCAQSGGVCVSYCTSVEA